jgi:uncharacterized protein with ParB-like and HNH nuclease domain
MAKTTFKTNPIALKSLLHAAAEGKPQLPDFQRSWVWEEERITSLISSVSRGFPVGALLAVDSRSAQAAFFARRPVEGAPAAKLVQPEQLLLDGQQCITSLFQSCVTQQVVKTIRPYEGDRARTRSAKVRKP